MNERNKGIIATVMAALIWSTGGLLVKVLPQDAFTILFYRSGYALLIFGLVFRKEVMRFNRQMWINSIIYALLLLSFVWATKLTTAANAIFLQYTGTAYVLLLEPIIFKIPLRRINLWTTIICFLGMGLFFLGDLEMSGLNGMLIATFSGLLMAGLYLGQRANAPEYHIAAIFWGNLWVSLIGLPAFLQSAPPTMPEHLMLAFLGFVQIGLGFMLFTYGLKRIPAVESALITMLEPVLNPIWVLIGYGERPATMALVGGTIIVLALATRIVLLERHKLGQHIRSLRMKS
ncbi:MAG: membrane protein [Saprospiraceae bacterium]|nr:MAG: membrane protein [Saprospiraceae bacterium]